MTRSRAWQRRLLWSAVLVAGLAICALVTRDGVLPAREDLTAQRARVEALSPPDKEQLLEHQKRFARLTWEEQDRLRRLNRQIDEDSHGPELRAVMHSYGDWLKTLPLYEQAEVAELHGTERVAKIKKLQEDHAKKPDWRKVGPWARSRPGTARLNPEDVEGLLKWLEEYVNRRGTQSFLMHVPESKRKEVEEQLTRTTDQLHRLEIFAMMWLRRQIGEPGKALPASDEELADLRRRLSPETRKRLESSSPEQQWRTISFMIPEYLFRQFLARGGAPGAPAAGEEELADFFEKHLTSQERDRLVRLPGDMIQFQLWSMYMNWKYGPPYPGRRDGRPSGLPKGFGPPRGPVPGDGPPPEAPGPGMPKGFGPPPGPVRGDGTPPAPPVPGKPPGGKTAPEAGKPPAPDGT
jgi:hypothetical protein